MCKTPGIGPDQTRQNNTCGEQCKKCGAKCGAVFAQIGLTRLKADQRGIETEGIKSRAKSDKCKCQRQNAIVRRREMSGIDGHEQNGHCATEQVAHAIDRRVLRERFDSREHNSPLKASTSDRH